MSRKEESPTYRAWCKMKSRCYNPNYVNYAAYGGRGITVCSEWLNSFETFLADMGERPERIDALSLDRIDNSLNYSKDNCRWATAQEQASNKRKPKNNTSGVVGVYWVKRENLWKALAKINGCLKQLYRGNNFEAACKARKDWEVTSGKGKC